MTSRIPGLAVPFLLAAIPTARGGVTLELIDRGVPTNGTTTATGYRGYTVRLVSGEARFTAVDFDSGSWGIFGPLVQTWTSSGEDGSYDSPTPGLIAAQNLTPSRMNFDSHYLPPGGQLVTPPISPNEDATIGPAGSQFATFPANTALHGTGLGGRLAIVHGFQGGTGSTAFDLAYVVVPDGDAPVIRGGIARLDMPIEIVNSAPTWSGGQDDLWNSAPSNTNWTFWGKPVAFKTGNVVQFTDTSATNHTVQVDPAGVAPRHIDITISGEYSFSGGRIDSSGRLLKDGMGCVTFNNPVVLAGHADFAGGAVLINSDFSAAGTIVRDCVLGGGGVITGGVKAGHGATIAPGGTGHIDTLTVDRLEFTVGNPILSFDLSPSGTDRLNVTGPDGFVASNATFKLARQGNLAPGLRTFVSYAGAPLPSQNTWTLTEPTIGGLLANLVNNTAGRSIDLLLSPGPSWNTDADGTWSRGTNWSGGVVPNGVGIPVTFGSAITAPRTVSVRDVNTVGALIFDSPVGYNVTQNFSHDGSLILNKSSDADHATIDVLRGEHSIGARVYLFGNTKVTIAPGSTLTMAMLDTDGTTTLTKSGAGTLKIVDPGELEDATTVEAGTLILQRWGSQTGSFTVQSGATLAGNGTLTTVVLEPGSRIAPSEGIAQVLTIRKLTVNAALLDFDLSNSGADRIAVTDADRLLLNGISNIDINITGSVSAGIYPLIDYTGTPLADLSHFILASLPDGAQVFLANNVANTSVDLVLAADFVPEPGALLTLLSIGFLAARRRSW